MTENKHNDRGLLLAVGGFVVAGAAGIAILAGMQTGDETAVAKSKAPVVRSEAVPAVAVTRVDRPARVTVPAVTLEPLESPVIAEPVAVQAAFQIDPTADLTQEGQKAYALGRYDEAVAYFQAQTDSKPRHAWAHYMLGLSQWKSGELEAATESLERSAALNTGAVKTWINLSRVENDRGRFEQALTAAVRARTLDETNPNALFLEGRSLRNLGRIEEAEDALQKSREYDPDNGYAANLLGLIQLEQDRELAAVVTLTEAVQAAPNAAFIHNNLGIALERTGREAEALVAFRKVLELNPAHGKAAVSLARVAARVQPANMPIPTNPDDPTGGQAIAEVEPIQESEITTPKPFEVGTVPPVEPVVESGSPS